MRKILIKKGKSYGKKWFQVIILDTFTGETIIIDNNDISEKVLTEEEYLKLYNVQDIIHSDLPLYQHSQQ